eukprot:3748582-Amphidinium_carterae.1
MLTRHVYGHHVVHEVCTGMLAHPLPGWRFVSDVCDAALFAERIPQKPEVKQAARIQNCSGSHCTKL